MGNAPLERDIQIELMKTAKKRHEDRVQRWKADETVKNVLRQPAEEHADDYKASHQSMKLKRCA